MPPARRQAEEALAMIESGDYVDEETVLPARNPPVP